MDTKEKILLGMLDLIYELGLEKASIGKLCKKAKISPGNIYFYFESKKVLIDTLYEYCVLKLIDYLDQDELLMETKNNINTENCKHLVKEWVRRYIQFLKLNMPILEFIIASKSSHYLSDDIKKGRFKKNKSFGEFLEKAGEAKIIRRLPPDYITTFVLGSVYEVLRESLIFNTMVLDENGIENLTDMIWAGLKYE